MKSKPGLLLIGIAVSLIAAIGVGHLVKAVFGGLSGAYAFMIVFGVGGLVTGYVAIVQPNLHWRLSYCHGCGRYNHIGWRQACPKCGQELL